MTSGPLLHDALLDASRRQPDRAALIVGDRTMTNSDLDGLVRASSVVLARLGVAPGVRVAVMMSNRPEFVAAVHAISRLGAAAVLISPAWKVREVRHAVDLVGAELGIADDDGVTTLSSAGLPVVDVDAEAHETVDVGLGSDEPVGVDADTDVVFVFSSGTTGLPKAVRHTHRSLAHATLDWVRALGLGPDDRFQVATPPSHILGLLNLLAAGAVGAVVRLHRRFDLDTVLRSIESDRLTLEMAVAPIALAIAQHPDLERFDLSSLRYIMWGATPVTPAVAETVTRRTGVGWLPAYGASEVPVIACNPVDRPEEWRLDSVGVAPEGVDLRVVDLESGNVLADGQVGEIQVMSPSAMAGYLPDAANDDAFDGEWYRTGDVGWLEAGWVHLTDRSKDMIKVKGFQVAPAEIEAVVHSHPGVADCAVFGVSDPAAGEVPVAAVQPVSGWDPAGTEKLTSELSELVATQLATYKRLHAVVLVGAVPRLPSGKALRRQLRDEWVRGAHDMEDH